MRQKMDKEIEDSNNPVNWLDLTAVSRTPHPTTAELMFFSSARGTFSKTGHTLGREASLDTFKKIEIIENIVFDHNGMKLKIGNRKNIRNSQICGNERNNTLLKNQWVREEFKGEIRKYFEMNENGNTTWEILRDVGKAALGGKFIAEWC